MRFRIGTIQKTALVLFALAGTVHAQEGDVFSLGLGLEGNGNARRGAALGGVLLGEVMLTDHVAIGGKFGLSYDFDGVISPDLAFMLRYYLFKLGDVSLFVQGGLGGGIFIEDSRARGSVLGEGGAGVRIPLKTFYLEPYVRGGYPFMWGFGIAAGYRRARGGL
jgi:hypothetical protein